MIDSMMTVVDDIAVMSSLFWVFAASGLEGLGFLGVSVPVFKFCCYRALLIGFFFAPRFCLSPRAGGFAVLGQGLGLQGFRV